MIKFDVHVKLLQNVSLNDMKIHMMYLMMKSIKMMNQKRKKKRACLMASLQRPRPAPRGEKGGERTLLKRTTKRPQEEPEIMSCQCPSGGLRGRRRTRQNNDRPRHGLYDPCRGRGRN